MTPGFAFGYWSVTAILFFFLLFDRKSILLIGYDGIICFRKRPFTSLTRKFARKDILRIERKRQRDFGESSPGISDEIDHLSLVLANGTRIRLGSFAEKDCLRLQHELMPA